MVLFPKKGIISNQQATKEKAHRLARARALKAI
jgi:hypothetical protein